MAKKMVDNLHIAGKALVLGAAVVILTPMISGALSIPDLLDLKFITLGTAGVAGAVAFGVDFLIEKYWP